MYRFFPLGPVLFDRPAKPGRESLSNSYPYGYLSETLKSLPRTGWISQPVCLEIPLITTDRAGILLTQRGVVRLFRYNCNIRNPYYIATTGQLTCDADHLKFPALPKHDGYQYLGLPGAGSSIARPHLPPM